MSVIAAICILSVIWGNDLSFAVILEFNEWVHVFVSVTTTASDVSDSNDGETFGKNGLPRAGFGLCETADVVCA